MSIKLSFNVVLVNPQIPQNTGNIARLSAATNSVLHVIHPLGFEISEKQVRRAGLDYWPEVEIREHASWEEFLCSIEDDDGCLWFFSTKGKSSYLSVDYRAGDYLIFGNEGAGLAKSFYQEYQSRLLRIPIVNQNVRSLNLANAVAIVIYEGLRQNS